MHSIAKKFCVTKLFSENCVRDLLHLSLLALSSFGVDLDFDCQGHRWSVVYHVFVIKPMLSHFQKVWSTLHLPRSVFSCWLTTQDISNGTQHQFRLVNIIFCRWNTTNYVTIYRIFFFFFYFWFIPISTCLYKQNFIAKLLVSCIQSCYFSPADNKTIL